MAATTMKALGTPVSGPELELTLPKSRLDMRRNDAGFAIRTAKPDKRARYNAWAPGPVNGQTTYQVVKGRSKPRCKDASKTPAI
jgi:hypothetical protein